MTSTDDAHTGQLMKAIRVYRGMTPQAVADRAGVDVKTIRTLESGSRRPQDTTERKIEDALNIPAGTIATVRGDQNYRLRFFKLIRGTEPSPDRWLDPDEEAVPAPKSNKHFTKQILEAMSRRGLTPATVAQHGGPTYETLQEILQDESVDVSDSTLRQLDTAFRWEAGSAASTLAGGKPLVESVLRDKSGRMLQHSRAVEDSEQEELERLRLASIIMDVRDIVRSQSGPLMSALTSLLDEAAELVLKVYAGDRDIENARWFVDEARAANTIRRQGNMYVVDRKSGFDHLRAGATPPSVVADLTSNDAQTGPHSSDDAESSAAAALQATLDASVAEAVEGEVEGDDDRREQGG